MALNNQQDLFCAEYANCHNATEAAEKAGYSKKSAHSTGHRLLKNAEIRARIAEYEKQAYEEIGVTAEKVARELARIAFADATKYAQVEDGEDGQTVRLTPTKDLTPDERAAISCIKQGKFGIEVQTYDKTKALELIGRYLAMFTDKTELSGGVSLTMESYLEDLDKQGEGQAF